MCVRTNQINKFYTKWSIGILTMSCVQSSKQINDEKISRTSKFLAEIKLSRDEVLVQAYPILAPVLSVSLSKIPMGPISLAAKRIVKVMISIRFASFCLHVCPNVL